MSKFHTGDVVRYIGTSWTKGQEHIIHKVDYCGGGRFQYSTSRGAWFTSKEFELVRKADKESFAALDKAIERG